MEVGKLQLDLFVFIPPATLSGGESQLDRTHSPWQPRELEGDPCCSCDLRQSGGLCPSLWYAPTHAASLSAPCALL